jgi:uridine kinase
MKRTSTDEIISPLSLRIKFPQICAKIVLIGGGSASGKTTIARALCDLVRSDNTTARCISMDNFYRSLGPDECGDSYNWDAASAYDVDALISCLISWTNGRPCWIPRHDFAEYKSVPRSEFIVPSHIIIIEGIHALSIESIARYANLRLFVTCDSDEALARRITRDINERGYEIGTILSRYFTYVKPALISTIAPSQKSADYIITNCNGGEVARDNTLTLVAEVVKKLTADQ